MPATLDDLIDAAVSRSVDRGLARIERKLDQLLGTQRPQFVGVREAAKLLGCSPNTVWRQLAAGTIAHKRVGRRVLIDLAALRTTSEDAA